ncbi:MAG: glutaredoxin family protein [Actinobacteria bacterium]|nr:glutaredoxin family protein [Actinomycetota bacterium]
MTIRVYALSTCPYCRMARKYLDDNDVEYDVVEVDLLDGDERAAAIAEVKDISGGTSFPVMLFDDEIVVGFNKKRMMELLSL